MKIFGVIPASWPLCLLFPTLLATPAPAAPGHPACEPSKTVRLLLDQEADLAASCGSTTECLGRRRALVANALVERPLDLFLHRAYQDLFSSSVPASLEIEKAVLPDRYRRLAADHPREAAFVYLLGRLLTAKPDEARAHFSRALELDGSFPWAHYALASTPPAPGVAVPAGSAAGHLAAFQRLCPSRDQEVLRALLSLRDETGLEPIVAAARTALGKRKDVEALEVWRLLWQAEFQLASDGDLEPVRQRVAADLKRVESKPQAQRVEHWHTVIEGRELSRDHAGAAVARRELMRRFPCDAESAQLRYQSLEDELPEPQKDAPEAESQGWAQAMYQRSKAWSDECPDQYLYRSLRFGTAMRWQGIDTNQGLAEIEQMLVHLESGKARTNGVWARARAAEFLLRRELDPPRILALAETLRTEAEANQRRRVAMPGMPEKMRATFEQSYALELWQAQKIELRARALAGARDEAWRVLDDMATALGPEPPESADEEAKHFYGVRAAERAALEAELVAKEGQSLDALAMYRLAFDLRRRIGDKPLPEEIEAARRLWNLLGGSATMWSTFTAEPQGVEVVARAAGWEQLEEPLPELSLRDVTGKSWTLADLEGRTALVNVWATWCKPCHLELPHIQKLHEQFKDDPKVLVLTLNIDNNVGLVEPFLDRKSFTFPALLGFDFFEEISGGMISIPRNWLVSPDGVIRQEQIGFSPEEGESWRADVAARLEAGLGSP